MDIGGCPAACPFGVERRKAARHLQRARTTAERVILLRIRRAPESHDRVADVFVQRPIRGENDFGHFPQVFIEQADQLVRRQTFGDGGESANIAEQYGELLALAARANVLLRILFDQLDHSG